MRRVLAEGGLFHHYATVQQSAIYFQNSGTWTANATTIYAIATWYHDSKFLIIGQKPTGKTPALTVTDSMGKSRRHKCLKDYMNMTYINYDSVNSHTSVIHSAWGTLVIHSFATEHMIHYGMTLCQTLWPPQPVRNRERIREERQHEKVGN